MLLACFSEHCPPLLSHFFLFPPVKCKLVRSSCFFTSSRATRTVRRIPPTVSCSRFGEWSISQVCCNGSCRPFGLVEALMLRHCLFDAAFWSLFPTFAFTVRSALLFCSSLRFPFPLVPPPLSLEDRHPFARSFLSYTPVTKFDFCQSLFCSFLSCFTFFDFLFPPLMAGQLPCLKVPPPVSKRVLMHFPPIARDLLDPLGTSYSMVSTDTFSKVFLLAAPMFSLAASHRIFVP